MGTIGKSLPLVSEALVAADPSTNALFSHILAEHGLPPLEANTLHTLQVNVGKLCNQTCMHCHVDAGPTRTEIMTRETFDAIISVLQDNPRITTVDITGGAPEMNPHFQYFVEACRELDRHIIDRCNLTVFFVKGKSHLPQFLAQHQVEIIASLPCYVEENVDRQRGRGVFERSVAALRQLNQFGYGKPETGLVLNLVYNPVGPKLPPDQQELELDYKHELRSRYGIEFNKLLTITNMPISRFLDDLRTSGQYEHYMSLLVNNFNPHAVEPLMCRSLLSVGWDGRLFDCDFHQMANIPLAEGLPQTIHHFDPQRLAHRPIVMADHCFGCTAGAGSSCGGALTL